MLKIKKFIFLILILISSNIFADEKESSIKKQFNKVGDIVSNLPKDIFKYCILEKYNNNLEDLCCLAQSLLHSQEPKQSIFALLAIEKIIMFDKDINKNSQLTFYDILNITTKCLFKNKQSFKWRRFWQLLPSEFSQIYNKELCFKKSNYKCLFCNILRMRELCDKKYELYVSASQTINDTFFKAIQEENFILADMLLKHGADIKMQNKDGLTALYHATKEKKLNSIKFLLKNGGIRYIGWDACGDYLNLLCDLKNEKISKLFRKFGISKDQIWM
ncbi:MAG: ankyrin repeat domain-containing protein [Candidatus Babeliales bacterium]